MSKTIKRYASRYSIAIAFLACLAIAAGSMFLNIPSSAAGKKTKIDTPILTVVSVGETSVDLQVCAANSTGATGLPAGFSIQWMTQADYNQFGWPANSDDPNNPSSFCKASFSGNAFNSRYNLAAGDCVVVRIGDLLADNGASTNCPNALECNTAYVFRAFGHATSTLNRSDFTGNVSATTLPCGGGNQGGCTFTQGYWKNHNDTVCLNNSTSPLCVAWPTSALPMTLGSVGGYSETDLLSIYGTAPGGNGLIGLAHQLITAKLNIANNADPTAINATISSADALIGSQVVPPVGGGFLSPQSTAALTTALDNYNSGLTGPGHCPSSEDPLP